MTPRHQELARRKIVSALSALKHMIYCDISAVCDIAEVIPVLFKEGACGPVVVEDSGGLWRSKRSLDRAKPLLRGQHCHRSE
jgi:hypothetical protein